MKKIKNSVEFYNWRIRKEKGKKCLIFIILYIDDI